MKLLNVSRPWPRFLARSFDYILFYIVSSFTLLKIFPFLDDLTYLYMLISVPLGFVPIETLFLKFLGTTPGKALLGIHIRNKAKKKLSLSVAFKRSLFVWIKGSAFGIPLLNIVSIILFFKRMRKKGRASWDPEDQIDVYMKSESMLPSFISLFVITALIASMMLQNDQMLFGPYSKKDKGGWVAYHPEKEPFSISFPGEPEHITKEIPIPNKDPLPYIEYQYKGENDVIYSVSYTTFPSELLKWSSGLVLRGTLKILAKNLPNTKIANRCGNRHEKLPALDFRFNQGTRETSGRLILQDNRLYKVEVSYPREHKEEVLNDLLPFIYSFHPQS